MKTAVEWLVEQLENHNGVTRAAFEKCIQEAKAMEKQQMLLARVPIAYDNKAWEGLIVEHFEKWYNETFKSE